MTTEPYAKVIGSLNPGITEPQLWKILEGKGILSSVLAVKLERDPNTGNPTGAFEMTFKNKDSADWVCSTLKCDESGIRHLYLEPAAASSQTENHTISTTPKINSFILPGSRHSVPSPSCSLIENYTNLYVKNFPESFDDITLKSFFGQYGVITSCRVMRDARRISRGFGFVNFEKHEDAKRARDGTNAMKIAINKTLFVVPAQKRTDRVIELRRKTALLEVEEQKYIGEKGVSMLVSNLDHTVCEADLRKLFQAAGVIMNIRIVQDEKHAFVRFMDRIEASTAVTKLHGSLLGAQNIDLFVTPRTCNVYTGYQGDINGNQFSTVKYPGSRWPRTAPVYGSKIRKQRFENMSVPSNITTGLGGDDSSMFGRKLFQNFAVSDGNELTATSANSEDTAHIRPNAALPSVLDISERARTINLSGTGTGGSTYQPENNLNPLGDL